MAHGGDETAKTGGVAAIVLAAGRSTRMRSKTPKPLHPVCGRPLVAHILDALEDAGADRRIVVIGHEAETVRGTLETLYGSGTLDFALQNDPKGTGHAAQMAEPALAGFTGTVLVVPGDTPLLTGGLLRDLVTTHATTGVAATLLTAILPHDAGSYGRVLRDPADASVLGIVEAKDATPEQRAVREINTSVYAFDAVKLFACLRQLRPDNAQGELYLTDVIGLLRTAGERVGAIVSPDPDIVLGVNTRVELADVTAKMRVRVLHELMLSGVTIIDPATTFIEATVRIGQDTTIFPMTTISGDTVIGADCILGPQSVIGDSHIGDGVRIRASFVDHATIGDGCKIGPFANLRPNSVLHDRVKIGDFVEVKNAVLHEGVAAGHLAYLGDAEIGPRTNIGAGTITCNYDGFRKHRTTIGADAFIGSNSTLVAPVAIDHAAMTAAGSVITENVPAGALAVGRERQVNKEGWATRRRARNTPGAATTTVGNPTAGEGTDR